MARRKKRDDGDGPEATCYMPAYTNCYSIAAPVSSEPRGPERIAERLQLLEQNAMWLAPSLAALRAALQDIEKECARLNDPARCGQLTPEEVAQAAALADRVRKALAALAGR